MPIYNGGKYLNYSLSSILNQKMKDIEIIFIDDNSKDDSVEIIKNYIKKDKRIVLIENKENRKILFSKSIGALKARGKYIIELDQDDMFIKDNTFQIIYNESERNKADFTKFKAFYGKNNFNIPKINNHKKKIKVYEQPKLKFLMFKLNNGLLWGNLIRTDLYKNVIYNLWPIIINYQIIFQEDYIITFFLLIQGKKFNKINSILLYHSENKESASNGYKNNSEYYLSVIFTGIIFYDYYLALHHKDLLIITNYIFSLKKDFQKIQSLYPSLFNYFFGKILTNSKILDKDKNIIKEYFGISENCDSYGTVKNNKSFILNKIALENKITNKQKINNFELSIIIVFNKNGKIINLINSIIIQNFKNYEIIIICDNVDANKSLLLENYTKLNYNIKIINRRIKKGIIYSICEGVKVSSGKYLMILEEDCFFLEPDTFQNIHREIEKEYVDIFEINLYKIIKNNYINLYKCKHYESKFNLTKLKYNLEFNDIDINNELLTNKLFKTQYFKSIIKKFKINELREIIDIYYNEIFSFIIDSTNHSFKNSSSINIYINEFDINKFIFKDFSLIENNLINQSNNYIDFIFTISNDSHESKDKVLQIYFNILSIIFNRFITITNQSLILLHKFFSCKYISKRNKTLLNFYYNLLIN